MLQVNLGVCSSQLHEASGFRRRRRQDTSNNRCPNTAPVLKMIVSVSDTHAINKIQAREHQGMLPRKISNLIAISVTFRSSTLAFGIPTMTVMV
jgi:hypothetical protein